MVSHPTTSKSQDLVVSSRSISNLLFWILLWCQSGTTSSSVFRQ
uniref:Uncharacterized protein n=1 Tax=Arundo donax TaxID=35708 RepID=A0A0A9BGS0_ARUDO